MNVIVDRSRAVIRLVLCASMLVLLASCGGSAEEEAVAPAQGGSADIGPAGGLVSATFEGGASVTLTVPAHALAATTTIRIDPATAPADALAAMTMSPAGLQFAVPATLSVVLPASREPNNKLVTFGIGAVRVPIGAVDPATRTMVVDLPYLGVGAAAPASLRAGAAGQRKTVASARRQPADAAADASLQLFIQQGDLAAAVALWHQLVTTLASAGSRDNAIEVQEGFASLLTAPLDQASQTVKDQIAVDITTWRNVDCGQLTFSISAVGSFDFSSDFAGYAQRAGDVLIWGHLTQDLYTLAGQTSFIRPAACPTLQRDISAPIQPSFPAYLAAANTALGKLSPVGDFDTLLNTRLRQLLNFVASLETFDAQNLAEQVQAIASAQTVRLRAGAYTDCRANRRQVKQQTLLVKEIGDAGFEGVSPYGRIDLLADIEQCGMAIGWELRDAQGSVLFSGTAGGDSVLPGAAVAAATLRMNGADKLVIKGPLQALICPSGSANNEQLRFDAGAFGGALTSVGLLTPGNDNGYLEASNLELSVTQLQSLAQAGGGGRGELDITRRGSLCNAEFPDLIQHSTLVKFTFDFSQIQIDTASLPNVVQGTTYARALTASGGRAPFTWAASGLPKGLGLDRDSGVISGTPDAVGPFTVEVTATDANGVPGTKALSLFVIGLIRDGLYIGQVSGTIVEEDGSIGNLQAGPTTATIVRTGLDFTFNGTLTFHIQPDGTLTSTDPRISDASAPDGNAVIFTTTDRRGIDNNCHDDGRFCTVVHFTVGGPEGSAPYPSPP